MLWIYASEYFEYFYGSSFPCFWLLIKCRYAINDNVDWVGAEAQVNATRAGPGRSTIVSVKMGVEAGKKRKTDGDGGNAANGGRKNRRKLKR